MALTDIITPAWLKARFLAGVPLVDASGTAFPDVLYELQIQSAILEVESVLDLQLDPITVTDEKQDTFAGANSYPNYGPLRLRKRPVREIESLTAAWGQNQTIIIPVEWCNKGVEGLDFTGSLTIIPTPQAISTLSAYGLPLAFRDVMPLWWRVGYTAGWAASADVPADILNLIGLRAAIMALLAAADLILGQAGVTSINGSIDSLSTGTTSGAYKQRIDMYERLWQQGLAAASARYTVREISAL